MFCERRTRSISSSTTPICAPNQASPTSSVLSSSVLSPTSPNQSRFIIFSDFGDVKMMGLSVLDLLFSYVLECLANQLILRSRHVYAINHNFSTRLREFFLDGNVYYSDYFDFSSILIFWVVVYDLIHNGDVMMTWSKICILPDLFQKLHPPAAKGITATQELETKTAANFLSRSTSSSPDTIIVTTSPMPCQPDSFRFRFLKTDSDFYCYSRHFGYYCYSRHFGYVLGTVTVSWVTVTLIALCNQNLKKPSSCYLHVLMNIGLDLIQSMPSALIPTDIVFKISLALVVCSSPLREKRRSSETVFRSDKIELLGKNWWRYYKLSDFIVILKKACKVFDSLNRLYQYMF